ncbi:MAG: dienelactone hydrolase family protein [Planctomycetota bacterium]|nr:dienelactone hydrolase family protein [Planctomycetota bacterium]MDA1106459.1 dienelactone hydrolase family protein [Planctomycetota bacterium]
MRPAPAITAIARSLALVFALAINIVPRALADDLSAPGPMLAARRDVTVVRMDGTTFPATVHYPGTSATIGAPLDPGHGPYPIVAFGHGFLAPVAYYQTTGAHMASWGLITIMPQTNTTVFAVHAAFAADLVSSLHWLAAQGTTVGSPWFGGVDANARGVVGHSMGGGCAILAAQADPSIRCAVPWAALNTTPSSNTAALDVECATRLIIASDDTIVPPSSTASMYPNLAGPSQLVTIIGGVHCAFADPSPLFCTPVGMTHAQQQAIVRRETMEFLLLYLRGDSTRWNEVWGAPPAGQSVTQQSTQTPDLDGDGRIAGADLAIMLSTFGTGGSGNAIRGDLNNDGAVDGMDLSAVLAAWTG